MSQGQKVFSEAFSQGVLPSTAVPKRGEIDEYVDQLHNNINYLNEVVKKLLPIINLEKSQKGKEPPPERMLCPLANELRIMSSLVEEAINVINKVEL